MPSDSSSWIWWLFSALGMGIFVNLISQPIGKFLAARFEAFRRFQATNNEEKRRFITSIVKSIETDSQVLDFVMHKALRLGAEANFCMGTGFTGIVFSALLSTITSTTASTVFISFFIFVSLIMALLGQQIRNQGKLYDEAVNIYHKRFNLPEPPR